MERKIAYWLRCLADRIDQQAEKRARAAAAEADKLRRQLAKVRRGDRSAGST